MPKSRFSAKDIGIIRRAFARQMVTVAAVADHSRLEAAFAEVPTRSFPRPRTVAHGGRDRCVRLSDVPARPRYGLSGCAFRVTTGKKSQQRQPVASCPTGSPRSILGRGNRIVHIGAGSGYYTAILSHLTGPKGHVIGVEFDPALAEIARRNLAAYPNVTIVQGRRALLGQNGRRTESTSISAYRARPRPGLMDSSRAGG